MRKILVLVMLTTMLLTLMVPSAGAQFEEITSVCLVTDIGRVDDGTFNEFAFVGMTRVADEFDLDTTFIETQSASDYAANIGLCVDEGFSAVVVVGFFLQDATLAAAQENPDIYFLGVDQFVEDGPDNYIGIQAREDQAGFLAGALAALVTESEIVAGVYGDDIAPIVRFRNGFEQGVRFVNEDVLPLGVYIDDFQAPDRGAAAAEQFIGEGADVIFGAGGPTGSGGILAAAQEGVYVIGVDQDEYNTTFGSGETPGAEYLISSALKRIDIGVYDMIVALITDDTEAWPGGSNHLLTIENDGIDFAGSNDSDIPSEVYDQLTEVREGLRDGDIETGVDPVTGELLDG